MSPGGVFLGRDRELAEITAALADEACARSSGVSVHWGRCWESGGAPAYWPWTQVLTAVAGSECFA